MTSELKAPFPWYGSKAKFADAIWARLGDLYQSDREGRSDDLATEAYEWSLKHGDEYRIAYCCHAGDFALPAGWESVESTFAGIKRADRQDRMDQIMFSPACVHDDLPLFAEERA